MSTKPKLVAILTHSITREQLKDPTLSQYEITYKPQPRFKPDTANFGRILRGLLPRQYDALWVQGDYRLFGAAVILCYEEDKPLYIALTDKKNSKMNPEGQVRTKYSHLAFVRVV